MTMGIGFEPRALPAGRRVGGASRHQLAQRGVDPAVGDIDLALFRGSGSEPTGRSLGGRSDVVSTPQPALNACHFTYSVFSRFKPSWTLRRAAASVHPIRRPM